MNLSIVIPTFNETKSNYLPQILDTYKYLSNIEIIIADGGSSDDTLEIAQQFTQVKILTDAGVSRAKRLNQGIAHASNSLILLHHPRSILSTQAIEYLINNAHNLTWGGFTHSFNRKHPILNFTSWYSNNIRPRWGKILYLDHCIFAQRDLLLRMEPLPEVDIFVDTLLSQNLAQIAGRPTILPFKSKTSAIRFESNGIYRQALMNQYLKIMYFLGQDLTKMNKSYEKDLALNSKYSTQKK